MEDWRESPNHLEGQIEAHIKITQARSDDCKACKVTDE